MFRALRPDTGNFSWGSEALTRKTRILDVVYYASNNELVSTQTLVKNAINQVDAAPFCTWYSQHYGVVIGKKKKASVKKDELPWFLEIWEAEALDAEKKQSNHVLRKISKRVEAQKLNSHLEDQFASGRLLACISSWPGQCGRSDGYV
uniref:Uncharacterized protein n=1 Tax=Physcomitrium patens TaxID=3218 RepID=A0A7I4CA88_PHYPA